MYIKKKYQKNFFMFFFLTNGFKNMLDAIIVMKTFNSHIQFSSPFSFLISDIILSSHENTLSKSSNAHIIQS